MQIKTPPRMNVNGFGLRHVLKRNQMHLVGRGEEPCRLITPPTINVNGFGLRHVLKANQIDLVDRVEEPCRLNKKP